MLLSSSLVTKDIKKECSWNYFDIFEHEKLTKLFSTLFAIEVKYQSSNIVYWSILLVKFTLQCQKGNYLLACYCWSWIAEPAEFIGGIEQMERR